MPKLLLFIGLLLIFGCHKSNPKPNYTVPAKHEIYNVLKAVVDQENIVELFDASTGQLVSRDKGKKSYITLKDFPLSVNLIKIPVDTFDRTAYRSVFYQELITSQYFKKRDSAYLFFQNDTLRRFTIDTSIMPGLKFTSALKLKREWTIDHHGSQYYKASIPVFSLDGQFARVELDVISGFNMGAGYVFYLRRVKGKWIIVKQYQTWLA